jgi:hypothetical protein
MAPFFVPPQESTGDRQLFRGSGQSHGCFPQGREVLAACISLQTPFGVGKLAGVFPMGGLGCAMNHAPAQPGSP